MEVRKVVSTAVARVIRCVVSVSAMQGSGVIIASAKDIRVTLVAGILFHHNVILASMFQTSLLLPLLPPVFRAWDLPVWCLCL